MSRQSLHAQANLKQVDEKARLALLQLIMHVTTQKHMMSIGTTL